jgi:TonB family protein
MESLPETRKALTLASLPRLEEVGSRRVANLSQALALEEKRQEAVTLQKLEAVLAPTHRHVSPAAELLKDAGPKRLEALSRLSRFLPGQGGVFEPKSNLREASEPIQKKLGIFVAPLPLPLERSRAKSLEEKKKTVEIKGPLAGRKVISFVLPPFPDWAKKQGVLEAAVSIRFAVSQKGEVLSGMRVEQTSGYGALDRLAMEALKGWRFTPLSREENQWGIITFRFILE